jgi:hypothetical protein
MMTRKVQRGSFAAKTAIFEAMKNHLFPNGDGTFRYSNNHTDATFAEYVSDNAVQDEKGVPIFGPITGSIVQGVRQEMFGPLRSRPAPRERAPARVEFDALVRRVEAIEAYFHPTNPFSPKDPA